MRDGDSEVLLPKFFFPRTRGRAWNTEVALATAKQLAHSWAKTTGEGQNAVIENLLS